MSKQAEKRQALKDSIWPDLDGYSNPRKGWFKGRRSLPMLLSLLTSKKISGNKDPSLVYLELFSRHFDEGLIELGSEADHAFASGYSGKRAVRTWHERIKLLEELGFIKTMQGGTQRYKYVLLLNPFDAIAALKKKGLVPEDWLNAYRSRCIETGEKTADSFQSHFTERRSRPAAPEAKRAPSKSKGKPAAKR